MMIRQADLRDLNEVVRVHRICFPNSFSTALGKGGGGGKTLSFLL